MSKGIVYLLTGPAHGTRLVVSLASLRQYYSGPVCVYTTRPESHAIGRACATDSRLDVTHAEFRELTIRKNAAFLTKISLLRSPPFELTAYLDCDTLITGNIDDLLTMHPPHDVIATQFAGWVTTGKTIRNRIERWRHVPSRRFRTDALVDSALERPRPSVNGGVIAVRRDCDFVRLWYDLSMEGRNTFICDEVALHLLLHHFPHRLLDCRWNNSPTYGIRKDVRIWHFHGDKHLKANSASRNWLSKYLECVQVNLAGVAEWGRDESLLSALGSQGGSFLSADVQSKPIGNAKGTDS